MFAMLVWVDVRDLMKMKPKVYVPDYGHWKLLNENEIEGLCTRLRLLTLNNTKDWCYLHCEERS